MIRINTIQNRNKSRVVATFTLAVDCRTSAGVYSNDKLIRTLWSGIMYKAGVNNIYWDGLDDDGLSVTIDNTHTFKILSNNVTYTWQGTIGNTSANQTGATKFHAFHFITTITIAGSKAYCGAEYTEGPPAIFSFNVTNPTSKTYLIDNLGQGTAEQTNIGCTDGTNMYWAAVDPFSTNKNFVYATKIVDNSFVSFTSGVSVSMTHGRTFNSVVNMYYDTNATITGIAVQKTGNYLFIAHSIFNQIHVLNKVTGALVQTLTLASVGNLCVDGSDNLWSIYGTSVTKYTVNTDGTTTSILSLTGLVQPQTVQVSYDGTFVVVADGGSSQQLKAYNNTTGAVLWTLGQAGGYNNSPLVANDKFYFSDLRKKYPCSIAFQSDGSFWVLDNGNNRIQHFTGSRTFIETVMYLGVNYDCTVNPNDATKVYSDFLEFQVDYTSPIASCWTLKNNWGYNIPANYDNNYNRLKTATTLGNGRTYATLVNSTTNKLSTIELTTVGVRFIADIALDVNNYNFYKDGSLRGTTGTFNNPFNFLKMPLTGFDGSGNPIWGSEQIIATTNDTDNGQPILQGAHTNKWELTDTNIIVGFSGNKPTDGSNKYHLGGLKLGDTTWKWKAAKNNFPSYSGSFPDDGVFEIGNSINYAGNIARSFGRNIIWGYNGEGWKSLQTNIYNHFYDNGLFIGQFGALGSTLEAPFAMAGNAFSWSIVAVGSDFYLYHNDESYHSGVHRWKISGVNTIQEQTVIPRISFAIPVGTDLMAGIPISNVLGNINGWTRNPIAEATADVNNNLWSVTTMVKAYKSTDIYIQFCKNINGYYVARDLGLITSATWQITGRINWENTMPNLSTIGHFIDVLDGNGKVITRLNNAIVFGSPTIKKVIGNSLEIMSGTSDVMNPFINNSTPFIIQTIAGQIKITYGGASITAPIFDNTANIQTPRSLNINFYANGQLYAQLISIQELNIQA